MTQGELLKQYIRAYKAGVVTLDELFEDLEALADQITAADQAAQ